MTNEIATNANVPSNPSDRKKIASAIDEIVNCNIRISDERSAIKDIKATLVADFELDKDQISKWIKMRTERNRNEAEAIAQETFDGYDLIYPGDAKDGYNNVSGAALSITDMDED